MALLDRAHRDLERIRAQYNTVDLEGSLPADLRIDIHDLLSRHRSVLDFVAQEIASICFPPSKRPHFPIASVGKTRQVFTDELDKKFKSLSTASPALRTYLISVQHFGGDPWLAMLNELANMGKHDDLSQQPKGDFVAAYLGADGHDPAITLLGTATLVLEEGAALRIHHSRGKPLRVDGGQRITVDSSNSIRCDKGVYFKRVAWRDFHFEGVVEHTVIGLLEVFDRNLPTVIEKVLALTDSYREQRSRRDSGGTA